MFILSTKHKGFGSVKAGRGQNHISITDRQTNQTWAKGKSQGSPKQTGVKEKCSEKVIKEAHG